MRKVMDMQMKFGEIPIEKIEFDLKSRDEIPKVLIGLKHLYCNRKVREKVFQALMDLIPENVDPKQWTNRHGSMENSCFGRLAFILQF